jgi:hypothetical protein
MLFFSSILPVASFLSSLLLVQQLCISPFFDLFLLLIFFTAAAMVWIDDGLGGWCGLRFN